jgi:FlaA1/EpsC-like NDP-sugar epimerase
MIWRNCIGSRQSSATLETAVGSSNGSDSPRRSKPGKSMLLCELWLNYTHFTVKAIRRGTTGIEPQIDADPHDRQQVPEYLNEVYHNVRKAYQQGRATQWKRSAVLWGRELCLIVVSGICAFAIQFGFSIPVSEHGRVSLALGTWACAKVASFLVCGIHRISWRFIALHDFPRLFTANLIGSALGAAIFAVLSHATLAPSIVALDFGICFGLTTGIPLGSRYLTETTARKARGNGRRALIYGAGIAGNTLLREIQGDPNASYYICGFLDDDPRKMNSQIYGVRVLGAGANIGDIVRKHRAEEVLVTTPSATQAEMARIWGYCHDAGVTVKTVPRITDILEQPLLAQMRNVQVEDLLGRDPVQLDAESIRRKVQGKCVLVTGAGGSIGSELCRQLGRFGARSIIGFELSENNLYHLEQELIERHPGIAFVPAIGSICDRSRFREVLQTYKPTIIFHAAAFKHVPMMESHLIEAVRNNILGTYTVALEAAEHTVSDFIMISSDKAVRPTSVMGVTKRVAELFIRAIDHTQTRFVSVRFGNVLGSNGSVVPTFKRQIAQGGPVTVTHPEMRRYFMTIPEAVQLVLEASAMGSGGEIFVLDMGEPVKIVDLAQKLIVMSGLRPGVDVQIQFTGLRPGEKLFEELSASGEEVVPTHNPKITIFAGPTMPFKTMEDSIAEVERLCSVRDFPALLLLLRDLVPEYNPSNQVLRRIFPGATASLSGSAAQQTADGAVEHAHAC